MYKFNGTHTLTNMGAPEVTCPKCNGTGEKKIKPYVAPEPPYDDYTKETAQKFAEKSAARKK